MWFKLTGDERITHRCTTKNCGGQVTERIEVDGYGENYCSGCRENIEKGSSVIRLPTKDQQASVVQQDEVNRIRELMLEGVRESGERLKPREAALAAVTIAAECYLGQDKAAVELELHAIVTFVMTRIEIVTEDTIN